jgi:hypothetical protein
MRDGTSPPPFPDERPCFLPESRAMNAITTFPRCATLPVHADFVVAVARHWRSARDRGQPAQVQLYALLSPHHWEMLTPVLDSLMTLWESALARPVATGSGRILSPDEAMLLGLLDGSVPRHACVACPAGPGRALDCAIATTRIMIGLVARGP